MQDVFAKPSFQIKVSKRKNIPVSNSLLHDLEYSHTLSLYSSYTSKLQKRRAYSERVIKDKTPINKCCDNYYSIKSIVAEC